jgi:hypothetical protein
LFGKATPEEIIRRATRSRVSARELAASLSSYGRTLATPPGSDLGIQAVEIAGASPQSWSIWAPVWTVEEGQSDLWVQVTATLGEVEVELELHDLRVP